MSGGQGRELSCMEERNVVLVFILKEGSSEVKMEKENNKR